MATMSRIIRLLSGVALRNGAAPSATAMPSSDAVAHTSTKQNLSTSPASGPKKGIPTVRVSRYSTTIARLPAMPASKATRVGQSSTIGT